MSHVSTYGQKAKNLNQFKATLEALGIPFKENCDVQQYGRNIVAGAAIGFQIPGWKYEIAVMKDGSILYDHWGSEANTMERLGLLLQKYNEDVIFAEAYGQEGVSNVWVQTLEDGDRKLVIEYA